MILNGKGSSNWLWSIWIRFLFLVFKKKKKNYYYFFYYNLFLFMFQFVFLDILFFCFSVLFPSFFLTSKKIVLSNGGVEQWQRTTQSFTHSTCMKVDHSRLDDCFLFNPISIPTLSKAFEIHQSCLVDKC